MKKIKIKIKLLKFEKLRKLHTILAYKLRICFTDPKQKTVSLAIWRPEKAANQYRIIANFPLGLFDSHCLVTLASLARKVASTRIK